MMVVDQEFSAYGSGGGGWWCCWRQRNRSTRELGGSGLQIPQFAILSGMPTMSDGGGAGY